jgi:hypothetical protein
MPATVEGKMVDGHTIVLDHPLATGQQEVLMQKKKRAGRTKIPVPEQFVLAKEKRILKSCPREDCQSSELFRIYRYQYSHLCIHQHPVYPCLRSAA